MKIRCLTEQKLEGFLFCIVIVSETQVVSKVAITCTVVNFLVAGKTDI